MTHLKTGGEGVLSVVPRPPLLCLSDFLTVSSTSKGLQCKHGVGKNDSGEPYEINAVSRPSIPSPSKWVRGNERADGEGGKGNGRLPQQPPITVIAIVRD